MAVLKTRLFLGNIVKKSLMLTADHSNHF